MGNERIKRGTIVDYNGRDYQVLEDRASKVLIAPAEGDGARQLVDKGTVGLSDAPRAAPSNDAEPPPAKESKAPPAPHKEPSKSDGDDGSGGDDTDVLSGNIESVKDHVDGLDDVEELNELLAKETAADKPRKGVLDAIEARLKELEGGDGD